MDICYNLILHNPALQLFNNQDKRKGSVTFYHFIINIFFFREDHVYLFAFPYFPRVNTLPYNEHIFGIMFWDLFEGFKSNCFNSWRTNMTIFYRRKELFWECSYHIQTHLVWKLGLCTKSNQWRIGLES